MKHSQKTVTVVFFFGFILSGCSIPYLHQENPVHSSDENSFVYHGIDFGIHRDLDFKRGVKDGCTTASGVYTKDHNSFNNNISYRIGWEDGRLKCKGHQ